MSLIPPYLCTYDTNTCAKRLTELEGRPAGSNEAGWHQRNMERCRKACGQQNHARAPVPWVPAPWGPGPGWSYRWQFMPYPEYRRLAPFSQPEQRLLYGNYQRSHHGPANHPHHPIVY